MKTYPLTVPDRNLANLMSSWAVEADIRINWDVRVYPIVLEFRTATDRSELLAIARRKIGALDHYPDTVKRLMEKFNRMH